MEAPLTGREATEALGVYARLGAANARFDGRALAKAVLSPSGRARVLSALVTALRSFVGSRVAGRATRARTAARRPQAGTLAAASPGRPARLPGYVMARDCGHLTWTDELAAAGIDWCPICQRYVGVLVTRIPEPPRD